MCVCVCVCVCHVCVCVCAQLLQSPVYPPAPEHISPLLAHGGHHLHMGVIGQAAWWQQSLAASTSMSLTRPPSVHDAAAAVAHTPDRQHSAATVYTDQQTQYASATSQLTTGLDASQVQQGSVGVGVSGSGVVQGQGQGTWPVHLQLPASPQHASPARPASNWARHSGNARTLHQSPLGHSQQGQATTAEAAGVTAAAAAGAAGKPASPAACAVVTGTPRGSAAAKSGAGSPAVGGVAGEPASRSPGGRHVANHHHSTSSATKGSHSGNASKRHRYRKTDSSDEARGEGDRSGGGHGPTDGPDTYADVAHADTHGAVLTPRHDERLAGAGATQGRTNNNLADRLAAAAVASPVARSVPAAGAQSVGEGVSGSERVGVGSGQVGAEGAGHQQSPAAAADGAPAWVARFWGGAADQALRSAGRAVASAVARSSPHGTGVRSDAPASQEHGNQGRNPSHSPSAL